MGKDMRRIMTSGVDLPVGAAIGESNQTGIAVAVHHSRILISIVKDGSGLSVWLGGDQIDQIAGLFADAVEQATRNEAPSLRVTQ